jgi:hypothetical protein
MTIEVFTEEHNGCSEIPSPFQELHHAAPMCVTSRTPVAGKQSQRKPSVQITCPPARPGFVSTGHLDRPFDMVSVMDQKSIVLNLRHHLKGMSAQAIHDDLMSTLCNEAITDRTVTKYPRTAQFNPTKVPSNPDASSTHLDDSDRATLATLEEKPFPSVRELARATHLPPTTVYRRLINSFGLVLRHFH